MTIENTCVQCDGYDCKEIITVGLVPFNMKIKKIKDAQWSFDKVGPVWRHYCPLCSKKNGIRPFNDYWWNKD